MNAPDHKNLNFAKEAIAERDRLVALGREWEASHKAAAQEISDASAAAATADTQSVLAPATEQAGWRSLADEHLKRADEAKRKQARVAGVLLHHPDMLAATDEKIMEASQALKLETTAMHLAARQAVAAELRDVAASARPVLLKTHALAAAGVAVGLIDIKVPNPFNQIRPFIADTNMTLDEETISLNREWRNDPAAVALHDQHIGFTQVKHQLAAHERRIQDAKAVALNKANQARRWDPSLPSTGGLRPTPDYVPAQKTFIPNSWTIDPNRFVQDATVRGWDDPAQSYDGVRRLGTPAAPGTAAAAPPRISAPPSPSPGSASGHSFPARPDDVAEDSGTPALPAGHGPYMAASPDPA
jgi:hypothetical protein